MAVVTVQRVDHGRTGKRGAGKPRATAVEEDARASVTAAELGRSVRARDRRGARPAAAGGDANQVEKASPGARDDFFRKPIERKPAHERGHIRERCSLRAL